MATQPILIDDCIIFIFDKLKLREKVSLACTNSRFAQYFILRNGVIYGVDLKTIVDELHFAEQQSFFAHIGSYLEEFTIKGRIHRSHMDLIYKACVNITSLELDNVTLSNWDTNEKTSTLTHFHSLSSHLTDDHIRALKKFRKLRSLTLSGLCYITGKHINELTTLQELRLNDCPNVNSSNVTELLKALGDLHTLRITHEMSREVYQHLVHCSHKLETLEISACTPDVEIIAELPALKHLTIIENEDTIPLLHELARKKSGQLESLKVQFINNPLYLKNINCLKKLKILECRLFLGYDEVVSNWNAMENLEELTILKSPIRNESLLHILESCKNLRSLNIADCLEIDNDFLLTAITLLRRMKTQNKGNSPVFFKLEYCSISIAGIEKEYKQAEKEGTLTAQIIVNPKLQS